MPPVEPPKTHISWFKYLGVRELASREDKQQAAQKGAFLRVLGGGSILDKVPSRKITSQQGLYSTSMLEKTN